MKKILLTVCMAVMAMTMNAQLADKAAGTYTGDLDVFFQVQFPTSEGISVSIEKADDTHIHFALKNFVLMLGDEPMPVGNVNLSNIELIQQDDSIKFSSKELITITAGDLEGFVADDWLGPILGELEVSISGKIVGDSAIIKPITIPFADGVSVSFRGKRAGGNNIVDNLSNNIKLLSSVATETLSLVGVEGLVDYTVYTVTGSPIKQGMTTGLIGVSSLHKGVYLLKVGKTTMKFIKK